jgi:hypothetical protein
VNIGERRQTIYIEPIEEPETVTRTDRITLGDFAILAGCRGGDF